MDKDVSYCDRGRSPAVEEALTVDGKVAIICEQPDLAEEDKTLEPINPSDLVLLGSRTGAGYVRIRGPEGLGTIDKPELLREAHS